MQKRGFRGIKGTKILVFVVPDCGLMRSIYHTEKKFSNASKEGV